MVCMKCATLVQLYVPLKTAIQRELALTCLDITL